jgi:hypothetical protein
MATGGMTPIRQNLFYIGWGKQSAWGAAVPPTSFWRWLDGSEANPEAKFATEREGDTSPYMSLIYKSGQYWTVKVVEYLRPITAGCAFQALLGSGSDTYTAPAKSSTLAAAVVAGATTFQSTGDLGNSSTLAINFTPGVASATYEVQTVNLASRTGTGPYTYTLAAGATFKNAHNSGDTITSASTHVFARTSYSYDPYSIEFAFGDGTHAPYQAIRLRDTVCVDLKLTSVAGKPVRLEHTWYGAASILQSALATVVLEGTTVVGAAGGPLTHFMAGSSWQVDNAGTGNAGSIKQFDLTLKNTSAPDEFQSEGISPAYFAPANFDITGQLQVIFQNYQQYYETYYGAASPAANAVDSYLVGYGQAAVTWTGDGVNSLQASLPSLAYTAAKLTPKLDAKPLMQSIAFSGIKSGATAPLSLVLSNSQAAVY